MSKSILFTILRYVFGAVLFSLASSIFWDWLMARLGLMLPPSVDAIVRIIVILIAIAVFLWSQGGTQLLRKILHKIHLEPQNINEPKITILLVVAVICQSQYPFLVSQATERQAKPPDPYQQVIKTANADVQLITNANFDGRSNVNAGAAFGLGNDESVSPLITLSASQYTLSSLGNGTVMFQSFCNLDPSSPSGNKTISHLKNASSGAVLFAPIDKLVNPIPKGAHVFGGKVILTINGNIIINVPIPEQIITEDHIAVIPNIQKYLSEQIGVSR